MPAGLEPPRLPLRSLPGDDPQAPAKEVRVLERGRALDPRQILERVDRPQTLNYPEQLLAPFLVPDLRDDVASGAAEPTDRGNLLDQIPWPRLEAVVPACQCPHGAEIDDVSRVLIIQALPWEQANHRSVTTIKHAKFGRASHILTEPDAATAQNAPFRIEDDERTDRLMLDPMNLLLDEAAFTRAVFERIIL